MALTKITNRVIKTEVFTDANTDITTSGSIRANTPFFYNSNEITANVTIPANTNAMSAGPITVADNIEVTVGANSEWTVV